MGSAAAAAMRATHHGPTCRGQHGGGDTGSTPRPNMQPLDGDTTGSTAQRREG